MERQGNSKTLCQQINGNLRSSTLTQNWDGWSVTRTTKLEHKAGHGKGNTTCVTALIMYSESAILSKIFALNFVCSASSIKSHLFMAITKHFPSSAD
eukprot:802854-Amphidinium_carterae.2